MSARCPLYLEFCAGSFAVGLRLLGISRPPIAFMGAKTQWAGRILAEMGLQPGQGADQVLLVDAGPWGAVWPVLLSQGREVAAVLRSWRHEDPRKLWDRLAESVPESVDALGTPETAAQWLWLQGRSCNNVPVWPAPAGWLMTEKRTGRGRKAAQRGKHPDHRGMRDPGTVAGRVEAVAEVCGRAAVQGGRPGMSLQLPGTIAARVEAVSRLVCMDHATGRIQQAGQTCQAGIRPGTVAERLEGMACWLMGRPKGRVQVAAQKGTGAGEDVGLLHPEVIAERVAALPQNSSRILVLRADAAELEPGTLPTGTRVFIDPPYRGRTGYGWDLPRERLLEVAQRFHAAGAVVCVSEGETLDELVGCGWRGVEIDAGREFLTVNRPPACRFEAPLHQAMLAEVVA